MTDYFRTHYETSPINSSYRRNTERTIPTSNSIVFSQAPLSIDRKSKGGGNKIVEGTVVNPNISELEEEVRAGNSRRMRKELNGVVQGVSGRRSLLVRFHNG